jgi:hypothetical protein
VLRTLYVAQKNVAAYVALSEETGLTAQDCNLIATVLVGRRKPGEAPLRDALTEWNNSRRVLAQHVG